MRVFLVLVFLFVSFNADAEAIKIGVLYPLSGAGSFIGQNDLLGAQIAAEQINQAGGVNGKQIELVVEDSQTEPRVAVSAFKKLVEIDKVQVVLTALTSVGMAVRPLAEQAKVLMLAESTHPGIAKDHAYVLRNFYTVDRGNKEIIALIHKLNFSRIAVLHAEEEWGVTALSDLESRSHSENFKIVAHEAFSKGASDLKPQLLRLKEKKPQLIYLVGIGPAVPAAYNQARDLNIGIPFAGFIVCGQSNVFEPAKAALEGVYTVEADLDPNSEGYKALAAGLAAREGVNKIDQQIAIGFDSVHVIADALAHAEYSGTALRDYILRKKEFSGVTGRVEFTPDGDSVRPMKLQQIKNGACFDFR